MIFKKIILIILMSILTLLLFGCVQREAPEKAITSVNKIQTNIESNSYIDFNNEIFSNKEIRFWGEDYILYETTSIIGNIPYTNLYLYNIENSVTYTIEKNAKEFMIAEAIQLDKSHIVYIKRPSEYTQDNKIINQIICLNLETLEENIIKEEVTNHPVNKLKRINDNKFISYTPNVTESGYQYVFTIFDLATQEQICIDSFSYNAEKTNGSIASAFATDYQNIYIYVNHYEDIKTLPEQKIYIFDQNGVYQTSYSVDINSFLDIQKNFDGNVKNDSIIDMMKYNDCFLLKTQHCRYAMFKESNEKLLPIEVPSVLLEPFGYRLVIGYSNEIKNIFFYNLTDGILEYNTKTGVFSEAQLNFPENRIDYEIMSVYIDTKGKLLFQTSDWRKNDPDRSYGYFVLDGILDNFYE